MIDGARMNNEKPDEDMGGKEVEKPDLNDSKTKQRMEDAATKANACKDELNFDDLLSPAYFAKHGVTEKQVMMAIHDNEDGDADLLIMLFKDKYLYDHMEDRWYYWNEHYWREDILKHRYRLIQDIIGIYHEQADRESKKEQLYLSNGKSEMAEVHKNNAIFIKKRKEALQTQARKNNVLAASTQGLNTLGYTGEGWDQKHTKLCVKNGVIDLLKGTFDKRGHNQEDYIKTVSPTLWKGIKEPCPTWEKFLNDVFKGRPEIPNFLQRLFGYALRGDTPEHIFPIFFGKQGRNGKGTMFETIKYVLGPLAYKAPSEFLMTKPGSQQSADAPSATLMKLRGARLVWCSETNEGDRIDAAKLKELVGDDTISARAPYGKRQVEFQPTHTLFTMTNLKPQMPPNDAALWRRIMLIEFIITFIDDPNPDNPNEVKMDRNLKAKLQAEASGILAWLVRGSVLYVKKGLMPPKEIMDATKQYREDEDIFGHFAKECCEFGDIENPAYRETAKNLYEAYKTWCSDVGHHALSRTKFRRNLFENRNLIEKLDGPMRIRKIFGIALKSSFYTESGI